MKGRLRRWIPAWMQTIRFRLTVTYSAVLFGLAALVLGGIYLALYSTVEVAQLNPIEVQKWYQDEHGKWHPKGDQTFKAAELDNVEAAVNYETLDRLKTYSFAAIGGLFLASLGTGWWLSGRVLRPVRRITDSARHISATDLSRRINLDGPQDELRALAGTVDDMLGRLEGAFAAQRQMVDDASHELRNPLAVIRANIDAVLAVDDTTPDARAQAVTVVTRATDRMTYLVEDLLASARRSSPAFVDVDVDLAALANDTADEYGLLASGRGLRLTRRLSEGPRVAGDPQALQRAIDNLLSNAVRLAPDSSELVLAVGSRSGWAWLALRDSGPGIAQVDRERIFDRFYRGTNGGDPSLEDGERRTGLGLAIVRQIIESHGGAVAVHSEESVGSTFVLWLPDSALGDAHRRKSGPPAEDPLGSRRPPQPS
ncbi:sensor histidine kinase [Flindersiella endophytica]